MGNVLAPWDKNRRVERVKAPEYDCGNCFDTGCCCGGIGLSCHGCCSCSKGQEKQRRRELALDAICAIMGVPAGSLVDP